MDLIKSTKERRRYWVERKNNDSERSKYYLDVAKYYLRENDKVSALQYYSVFRMYERFYRDDIRMIQYFDNRLEQLKKGL